MGRGSGGGGRGFGGGNVPTSQEEMQALRDYTGADYQSINESLSGRESAVDDDFLAPLKLPQSEIDRKVKLIDSALEKMPPYAGTVHRGINIDIGAPGSPQAERFDDFIAQYKPGSKINFPEYLSTSTRSDSAFRGNIRYKIKSKGKNGRNLTRLNPEEGEVLFKRNTRFTVKSAKPIVREVGPANNRIKRTVGYEIELVEG